MVLAAHKTHVRQMAEDFRAKHGTREPLEMAQVLGVALQYGDLGDKDGAYDPERRVILLNNAISSERQRFTAAHEVIHALILEDGDFLSDIHDAYTGNDLEESIEILCNVGASALLVPSKELEPLLEKTGRSARAVPRITREFGVSKAAACVALAQRLDSASIVAVLRPKKGKRTQLEVEFSARSESMKYPLAVGTPIPEDHLAHAAWEAGLDLSEEGFIPFRSGNKMPARVDAHPEGGLVYALFTTAKDRYSIKSKTRR